MRTSPLRLGVAQVTLYLLSTMLISASNFSAMTLHWMLAFVIKLSCILCWTLEEQTSAYRYLLHDRDAKFTPTFDKVFAARNTEVIHTPICAPNADAYVER